MAPPPILFPWIQQQQQGGQLLAPGTTQYPTYKVYVDWDSASRTFSTGGTSALYKDLTPSPLLAPELAPTRGYGVKSVRIRRGRDDALTQMRAGEATITLHDPDGFYNPENAASPLAGLLLPLKMVFIAASNGSGIETTAFGWPLFFGFIRSIEHDPDRGVQESRIECGGRLVHMQRYAANRTVAASEDTVGAALLDVVLTESYGGPGAFITPGDNAIDTLDGTAIPSTWRSTEANALADAEALLVADRGCFFELAGGGMAYESRAARTDKAVVTGITDTMQGLRPGVDLDRVGNRVKVTRTGGEPQEANNATSQTAYGIVDIGDIESPYFADDAAALATAEYLVDQFGTPRSPMYRLDLMNRDIETTDQILQRELQDRITVVDALSGTSGDYYIEAIEHEITDGGKYHRCSWILSARGTGTATGHAGSVNTSAVSAITPTVSYLESTSLDFPSDPRDRDEVYVVADSTNGIVWHFRYRAASASSYKWEFVGGAALEAGVTATQARSSSTYGDLATTGPAVTVPFDGDYIVTLGGRLVSPSGELAQMSYAIGGTGAVDADAYHSGGGASTTDVQASRQMRKAGLTAGTALTAKYKSSGGSSASFGERRIALTPVRVTA